MGIARAFGVEIEQIGFDEARLLLPPTKTDDIVAVYYQPNDGYTSPVDTTRVMARGAKLGGASIFEGVKVTGISLRNKSIHAVNTDQGKIFREYVVNCGGMWAPEIGKMVGVDVPLHAAEHMHITTMAIEGVSWDACFARHGRVYLF